MRDKGARAPEEGGAGVSPVSPRLAVVIPLYNKASVIVETVKSVLAQRYADFTLFVIDDGSTDGSGAQVQALNDDRIRLIRQSNQGVSAARNRGLHEAVGHHYVAFLDADDHWYPWHLEELVMLIQGFPGAGLYSVAHHIRRGDLVLQPRQPFLPGFQGVVLHPMDAFAVSLSLVHSSTACVSRERALALGGFPEGVRNGEDVYLWLRLASEHQLVFSGRFCAEYRQPMPDEGGVSEAGSGTRVSASQRRDADLPYYLFWLDQGIQDGAFPSDQRRGAKRLLWAGLLYNVAGFKLQGNERGIAQVSGLSVAGSVKVRLLLMLLRLAPVSLLRLAKGLRHPKKHRSDDLSEKHPSEKH